MDAPKPSSALFLHDAAIRRGMELMIFAQSRFVRSADEKLAEMGLGRAHHRAMYLIGVDPARCDQTVARPGDEGSGGS
jgi:hypothetical protein